MPSKFWPSTQSAFGPIPVVPNGRDTSHVDSSVLQAPVTYTEVILATPDLAGYWKLSETSGTLVADFSGGGFDFATVNSPTRNTTSLVPTLADPSTDFNGSNQYAGNSSTATHFQSGGAISIECWINGDTTGNKCPFGLFGSGTDKGLWFNFQTGLQAYGSIDGSAQTTCQSPDATVTGTTYHVVATHDGSNIRLYVNGVLKQTTALAGTIHLVTTAGGLAIGRLGALSSDYFDGRVDEAAIYRRALTLAEIQAHYNAGASSGAVNLAPPVATATGQGFPAAIQIQVPGALATGTGSAFVPTITNVPDPILPPLATASGLAFPATIQIRVNGVLATGSGDAFAPTITNVATVSPPLATATGQAFAATIKVQVNAALATGTGAAFTPTLTSVTNIPLATATGQGFPATVQVRINGALATGTGAAFTPSVSEVVPAPLATASGLAFPATIKVVINGVLATGSGAAFTPSVSEVMAPPLATASGLAFAATVQIRINGALATGTGAAFAPAVTGQSSLNPPVATASGQAFAATIQVRVSAALATGSGAAFAPVIVNATVSAAGWSAEPFIARPYQVVAFVTAPWEGDAFADTPYRATVFVDDAFEAESYSDSAFTVVPFVEV